MIMDDESSDLPPLFEDLLYVEPREEDAEGEAASDHLEAIWKIWRTPGSQ